LNSTCPKVATKTWIRTLFQTSCLRAHLNSVGLRPKT
jgi:hypothetical protein